MSKINGGSAKDVFLPTTCRILSKNGEVEVIVSKSSTLASVSFLRLWIATVTCVVLTTGRTCIRLSETPGSADRRDRRTTEGSAGSVTVRVSLPWTKGARKVSARATVTSSVYVTVASSNPLRIAFDSQYSVVE